MNYRRFSESDAEFCYQTRRNVFIKKFRGELNPQEVAACVNAYMPEDYIKMSQKMPIFIVEEDGIPLGFFTPKAIGERHCRTAFDLCRSE